jgi:hypothetical protein
LTTGTIFSPVVIGGIVDGVALLALLGLVIWRFVLSGSKSGSVSGDEELDLIPEQTMVTDGMPETVNFVTESNLMTSETNTVNENFLDNFGDDSN